MPRLRVWGTFSIYTILNPAVRFSRPSYLNLIYNVLTPYAILIFIYILYPIKVNLKKIYATKIRFLVKVIYVSQKEHFFIALRLQNLNH